MATHHDDREHQPGAELVEAPGKELVPDAAIEGEIVEDEPTTSLVREVVLRRVATPVVTVVKVVRAERSRQAGKAVLRHGLTVTQGFESWAKRAWDASTLGLYRRQIRAAEASGNQELLAEWVDRKERATEARHDRLKDLPEMLAGVAKAVLGSLAALVALVLVVGLFVQLSGEGSFTAVLVGTLNVIRWVIAAVAFVWTPLVMVAPLLTLLAAWREGRRRGRPPGWLATAREADDIVIDETTIARALEALRIPQVTTYVKQGLPLQYLTPARRDGRGTHAVVRLPAGVTADKIARRRADLATGLHRLAKEVWPTTGAEAGILDLWVADKGALAEGAGDYPLLEDGTVDVFQGVPFGKTLRGTPVTAPLMERNTITGGMPGQGKSSAARVIMAGAALDSTVELRIWVPDANFDFEAFRPRCSRYVMGAEDEKIAEILAHLRELHAEVQTRGELLIRFEEPVVTRQLASKNVGLHPLFCLLEEAHVAIQHPTYGKEISRLLADIVRLGRKRGIHLIVSTQAPTKDSMPRDVTRNCSNGIAFAVGDHVANDALLGQGAYSAGHRATELIPGTDKGTAVVKGFTGERSDIVQVYFIDVSRTNDQITPIIDRAVAAMEERGTTAADEAPLITSRDLLKDVADVLGDEPVPAANVPALLAQHAPDWLPYRKLTGKALRNRLAAEGVKVSSTGNRWPVDPAAVRAALADRAQDGE
ncbi:S-DNA-T family DNA segregation ATPase FtsK/SpoIIIE [Prauserella shujinwangii]|uniref:S-DNA-T family DNA segregation ATPase FtsK/SpoIIIE n=1 Tax=Prauserella shujinwangii TaxID=1453103 RepID=A0A2T0LXE4_9PSEU|nr:cell division protein FtsK [Prauserella shujinwangii]PRX48701.1 S-DNA-T family DNA segregation ATPase FtsK/SpoIIIE [Prauserella shujinwangii]